MAKKWPYYKILSSLYNHSENCEFRTCTPDTSHIRTNFFTRLLLLTATDRPLRKSDETSFLTPSHDIWREKGKKRGRIIKVLQRVAMRSGRKVLPRVFRQFFPLSRHYARLVRLLLNYISRHGNWPSRHVIRLPLLLFIHVVLPYNVVEMVDVSISRGVVWILFVGA